MPRNASSVTTAMALNRGTITAISSATGPMSAPSTSASVSGRPMSTKLLRKRAWIFTPRFSGSFSVSRT